MPDKTAGKVRERGFKSKKGENQKKKLDKIRNLWLYIYGPDYLEVDTE